MIGTWTAQPDAGVSIALTLVADGAFTWAVTEPDRTQTIQGLAGFQDDVLVLRQGQGPPLTGAVRPNDQADAFVFKPMGTPTDVDGLLFQRRSNR